MPATAVEGRDMWKRMLPLSIAALVFASAGAILAEEPSARVMKYLNYDQAIELKVGDTRAVLCPQAGGRVLEFSVEGKQALWLDEKEKEWQPGVKSPMSAGRFDYGPELTVAPHPTIWSGQWTGKITGTCTATLTSPRDEAAGVQLIREYQLDGWLPRPSFDPGKRPRLVCRQTIINITDKTIDVCHWGRSFSPSGGIAFVPLGIHPSRFPSKYAMYEDSAVINVRNSDEKIRERDGWLEILGPPRKPKLGFDSYVGLVAYLMPNDTLFVKQFEAFPNRVYNEAAGLTLSIWYPEGPRIEIEPIGPRERLEPGKSASFTETWYLLSHPFPKNGAQVDLKGVLWTAVKIEAGYPQNLLDP
jgi:hypothetical protein